MSNSLFFLHSSVRFRICGTSSMTMKVCRTASCFKMCKFEVVYHDTTFSLPAYILLAFKRRSLRKKNLVETTVLHERELFTFV